MSADHCLMRLLPPGEELLGVDEYAVLPKCPRPVVVMVRHPFAPGGEFGLCEDHVAAVEQAIGAALSGPVVFRP